MWHPDSIITVKDQRLVLAEFENKSVFAEYTIDYFRFRFHVSLNTQMFRIAHIPVVTVARTRTHIRLFTSEVPPQDLPALYSRKPSTDNKAEKNKPTFQPQADGHLKPKTFDPESQPGANETAEDVELYDNVHPDDKPIRPPHGIKIDHENHGLSAFYRKFRQTNADGRWEWTLFETVDKEGSSRGG